MEQKSFRLRKRTQGLNHRKHQKSDAAVLIIDMISKFDFEDADLLFDNAFAAANCISTLKRRASEAEVPVIYVNDNYGEWKSDFAATLRSAASTERGDKIASVLRPESDDYHMLKPQRSGFFETPLDLLLGVLGVSELIITGVTTDICVLFTAHDAYMRGFSVSVPSDCCAAVREHEHANALALLSRVADANIAVSSDLDLRSTQKAA